MIPYFKFNRHQWAGLCSSTSATLTKNEIARIREISKDLSIDEVAEIYLPLSCLLNFYYSFNLRFQTVLNQFLGTNGQHIPYIISITGSVAVGKSTTAHILQVLLSRWSKQHHVELITTDNFLYFNQILKKRDLMKKKGFPQSYNMHRLIKSISDLRSGVPNITTPVYSHVIYDILPEKDKTITKPDILILEGLNVLQGGMNHPDDSQNIFISDFVDFSIYVDASDTLLKEWYINRFLKLCKESSADPNCYFYNYARLTKEEAINEASLLWNEINYINLKENILPTRERANLILNKIDNHIVDQIRLRK